MKTPTLDKFGLHPAGGYCTCFTHPYSKCAACESVQLHKQRWAALSPENRAKALAECAAAYCGTSNQDGR